MKYETEFNEYFSKLKIFTFKDAERFLLKHNAPKKYIKLFMHNQVIRHRLLKIGKGYYTFQNNEALVGFRFTPFYYGLEYALTIRKLWTQMANPIVLTATKAVPGSRMLMGQKVIVRRISKSMMFGFEYIKYSSIFIPVSDVEKTLIDFTYYKVRLSNADIKSMLKQINHKKIERYLLKYSKHVKSAVYNIIRLQT